MNPVEPAPGTFTKQELERLAIYRAAAAAGFYTDQLDSCADADEDTDTDTDTTARVWLPAAVDSAEPDGYAFTHEERQHLAQLKLAVADQAGRYADDQPPVATSNASTDAAPTS